MINVAHQRPPALVVVDDAAQGVDEEGTLKYLRHTAIATLELTFDQSKQTVSYRWKADEARFAMPVRVGKPGAWQIVQPTTEWKTMKTEILQADFAVATDLYYVNVAIIDGAARGSAPRNQ